MDNGIQSIENESDFIKLSLLFDVISKQAPKGQFNWDQRTAFAEILVSENLVYWMDFEIRSFLTYRKYADRLEIMACGTHPKYQQKGMAAELLQKLMLIAAQQGLSISLEVHEFNASAIKLYQKCGFQQLRTRKGYYSDGKDALIMSWPVDFP